MATSIFERWTTPTRSAPRRPLGVPGEQLPLRAQVVTVRRRGAFSIRASGDRTIQCGNVGTNVFQYEVYAEGDASHLDSRGFLVDNNDIQAYFDEKYLMVDAVPSCEQMADAAVLDLATLIQVLGRKLYLLEVFISGSSQAQISARWQSPNR
jgi:hypothetical protein